MASVDPASLFIILFLHFWINFATGFQDDDVDNSLFEQINDKLDRFRPIVVNTWNVPRATSKGGHMTALESFFIVYLCLRILIKCTQT